jgi:hypothetical protein
MSFFNRLSNGWTISMNSFKVLKANKQLILFPLLSGISLLLIMGSFFTVLLGAAGWDFDNLQTDNTVANIGITFVYYLVNYFVVVFFNVALTHCTRLYFRGEEVSIRAGINYSLSRIGAIFSWALFAATIGTILKYLQENAGYIGKIVIGLIGVAWSIATFFVVPVLAYEDKGPLEAFKRSTEMMKEKWGESLASTFSFGLVQFLAILLISLPLFFLGMLIHPIVGVALALISVFIIVAVISASQAIFVSAIYHNINGDPVEHFNDQFVNNLFEHK